MESNTVETHINRLRGMDETERAWYLAKLEPEMRQAVSNRFNVERLNRLTSRQAFVQADNRKAFQTDDRNKGAK